MKLHADLVKAQINALLHEYPELTDDETLLLDTLEGETDLTEFARQLVQEEGFLKALAAGVADYIGTLEKRKRTLEHRADMRRDLLLRLMELAHVSKLPLPEASVSVRAKARSLEGHANPDELPDDLVRITRTPNRLAIKEAIEAGRDVPGYRLDNGGVSLSIRRA
jgi:hypothetical protein